MNDAERRIAALLRAAAPEPRSDLAVNPMQSLAQARRNDESRPQATTSPRRWVAILGSAAAVVAVASIALATAGDHHGSPRNPSVNGGPGSGSPTAAESPTIKSAAPACTGGELVGLLNPRGIVNGRGGASQHVTAPTPGASILLGLRSNSADCALRGYPTIRLVDRSGSTISRSTVPTGASPTEVELFRGGIAYVKVRIDVGAGPCVKIASIVVSLPDGGGDVAIPANLKSCATSETTRIFTSAISATENISTPN